MNPESTPIKSKPLRPPPLPSIKKKAPSPVSPIRTLVLSSIPKRGGTYPIYGVFLRGGSFEAGSDMSAAHYRFSTQRLDEKSIAEIKRGMTCAWQNDHPEVQLYTGIKWNRGDWKRVGQRSICMHHWTADPRERSTSTLCNWKGWHNLMMFIWPRVKGAILIVNHEVINIMSPIGSLVIV
jgi:hypothetical protein